MRWLAKAALQRGIGVVPQGERLNYVFQRHVLHSLPAGDGAFRQKFSRAVQHLARTRSTARHAARRGDLLRVRRRLGPRDPARLRAARRRAPGAGRHPAERPGRARQRLARRARAAAAGARGIAGRELRPLGGPISSLAELEERFGIRYLAPCDARGPACPPSRSTSSPARTSASTSPATDLAAIFRECSPAAAAGRRLQLPDRPAGPLLVLRPQPVEVQLPPLLRPRVAARQLAAPPPEPAALAGIPAARARRRLRARGRADRPGRAKRG